MGGISLLSPEYLLSFERRSFHTRPPDHYAPVSCLLGMSASQSSALMEPDEDDEDIKMPLGQKIVIGTVAILAVIFVVSQFIL